MTSRHAVAKPRPKKTRKPLRFKQREVERALRAMRRMGLSVAGIEIDPITGKFAIKTAAPTTEGTDKNPWDEKVPA